jgi:hypothetical protein
VIYSVSANPLGILICFTLLFCLIVPPHPISKICSLQEVAHGHSGDTDDNGGNDRSMTGNGTVWLSGGAVGGGVGGRVGGVAGVAIAVRAGDGSSGDTSGVGADGGVDSGGIGGESDISTLESN